SFGTLKLGVLSCGRSSGQVLALLACTDSSYCQRSASRRASPRLSERRGVKTSAAFSCGGSGVGMALSLVGCFAFPDLVIDRCCAVNWGRLGIILEKNLKQVRDGSSNTIKNQ